VGCFSRSRDLDVRVEEEEIGVERPELSVAMMGVMKKIEGKKVWEKPSGPTFLTYNT